MFSYSSKLHCKKNLIYENTYFAKEFTIRGRDLDGVRLGGSLRGGAGLGDELKTFTKGS